jgi:hypothetical protein
MARLLGKIIHKRKSNIGDSRSLSQRKSGFVFRTMECIV